MRSRIAHLAARLMAEEGTDDYARAKRKAARQIGMEDPGRLPSNDEIDQALRIHHALYQQTEHDVLLRALRERALEAMREFGRFNPYLTGSVLNGNAGRNSDIDLQLFTDNPKAVELFLLERQIRYRTAQSRLYCGDSLLAAPLFVINDGTVDIQITVLPEQAARQAVKTSPTGRSMERAKTEAVKQLLEQEKPVL